MSSTPPTEPPSERVAPRPSAILQPKMQQKISLRFALGLLGVAALLFSWYFLRDYLQDPDSGSVNTAGWIAAVRQTSSGAQAVVIKPDGTIVDSPDYHDGAIDRDLVWQPDGERLFFSSDRDKEGKGYHIYRWNVSPNNTVTQRSVGTRAQEHPTYQSNGTQSPPYTQLVISAGVVVEFDPKTSISHQLIPVESKTPTQDAEGGSSSQFGPEYEHLGTSYREAYWCKGRKYIVGVMNRNDTETLVVQCMQPSTSSNPLEDGMPHGLFAGDHIDLAIDPKTGDVIYSVINFQFIDPNNIPPDMIKNGKAVQKFRNIMGFLDPDDPSIGGKILASTTPTQAFQQPQVSPDGSKVVFVGGAETSSGFKALVLVVCPLAVAAGRSMTPLIQAPVSSPSWSADGELIVCDATGPDGKSHILQIDSNGGNHKDLTNGKGSFSTPVFSPAKL